VASPSRDPEKELYWRNKIARLEKSGLSLPAFCRQEELNRHTLKSWIFKIRGRDGDTQKHTKLSRSYSSIDGRRGTANSKILERIAVIEKWRQSGLSQTEFCRQEGMKDAKFSLWKHQVAKLSMKRLKFSNGPLSTDESARVDFVALQVREDLKPEMGINTDCSSVTPVAKPHPIAELYLGEIQINVLSGADVETLRALFLALKEFRF
jgi:hypothetical protein